MPARICQRTSRRKAASSRAPSAVERRDEGGEGAAQPAGGWSWSAGCVAVSSGGGHRSVLSGSDGVGERSSSSTMGSKAWRPGSRGARREPVGGGEDPGGVGGSVARGQPELDGLAGGVEADEVHARARRRRGPTRPRGRPGSSRRGWPATIRRGEVGRRCPDGRSRFARRCHSRRYGSKSSSGPNSATAVSTSRPNSATPRLKFEAATAVAPWSRSARSTAGAVLRPAGRGDDEPPAAGLERGRHVGRDGVAARCLDDEVRPGEPRRIVRPGRWPAEDVDAAGAAAAAVRPAGVTGRGRPSRPRGRARRRRG